MWEKMHIKTNTLLLNEKQSVFMTDKVHKQIKYLCNKINNVEWSGILVYGFNHNENIFDEKVSIRLIDVIPMQKGNSTYTEYNFNEKKRDTDGYDDAMIDYFLNHPESMDINNPYRIGMIHSHQNFNTFFSGTDSFELVENGKLHDFYLSLITNNQDENIAKIAFPSTTLTRSETDYVLKDNQNETFKFTLKNEDFKGESVVIKDCNIIYEKESNYVVTKDEFFINRVEEIIRKAEIKITNNFNKIITKNIITTKKYKTNNNSLNKQDDIYNNKYLQRIIRNVDTSFDLRYDYKYVIIKLLKEQMEKNNVKISVQSRNSAPNFYWDPNDMIDDEDEEFQDLLSFEEDEFDNTDVEEAALDYLMDYFYFCTNIQSNDLLSYIDYIEHNSIDLVKDIDYLDGLCNSCNKIYNEILNLLSDYQNYKQIELFINELLNPDAI